MSHQKRQVAAAIAHYPFKGVEKFYDVGTLLNTPAAFKDCIMLMRVELGKFPGHTKLGALDARGFLFAAPLGLSLSHPVVMVRKLGKMPNTVSSKPYEVEYGHRDGMAVQRHAVNPGDKIVLIDDLVATGGTLSAAIEAVREAGGKVVGCLSLVELEAFAAQRAEKIPPEIQRRAIFATERELLDLGATAGALPEGYDDDGAAFEAKRQVML